MKVKDAVLTTLAMAGASALATGVFQPVAEVVYGVSDKLVNSYIPKSLRKPLPKSTKPIQPMKFDINNTPRAKAQFEIDKDQASWDIIEEQLDELSNEEFKNYDKDSLDRKYHNRFDKYKLKRFTNFSNQSEIKDIKKNHKLRNSIIIGSSGLAKGNLSEKARSWEYSELDSNKSQKKHNLKKGLKIALGATALGGAVYLGSKYGERSGLTRGFTEGYSKGYSTGGSNTPFAQFEAEFIKGRYLDQYNKSVKDLFKNDISNLRSKFKLKPNMSSNQDFSKHNLKKGLKIAGCVVLGAGALGGAYKFGERKGNISGSRNILHWMANSLNNTEAFKENNLGLRVDSSNPRDMWYNLFRNIDSKGRSDLYLANNY